VVLFIGRFAEEKNPEGVLSALAMLPSNWRAIMLGPDCGLKLNIQKLAKMVAPNRCWFPPVMNHVGDLLAMADVLCVPSRSEGHCLVVNEAWLAGLPVVTCAYEAMKEFDELHGSLCHLVPVGADGKTLAAAIKQANHEGRDSERVRRAREVSWELYTTPAMAARWERFLIDEVLPDWYSHALYAPLSTP
jgi:glycosyltransferase involved in cell wall biosynthesis